jgi:DNA-binding NarL/FixJ family response regulator
MPLIISVISLCLCIIGFFYFRSFIVRRTAARELLADYREEVYRLIAEIDAATDRDSLLVEERVKTLKKIIEDTDRRIAVYMREQQRSRTGEAMYTSLGRGIRAALDSRILQDASVPQLEPPQAANFPQVASRQQETSPQLDLIAPHEAAVSPQRNAAEEKTSAASKRKPKKTKLKAQIAELSAKGLTPQQIASRLNLSLAEIELALNLIQGPSTSL